MTIQGFEIVLSRMSKIYFAGEKVSGQITVQVDHQENIEALNLRLWGKASVNWREGNNGSSELKKLQQLEQDTSTPSKNPKDLQNVIKEEETYFDRRIAVLEKSGPADIIIPQGSNTYPFEIALPSGIPSSFEGEHGQVSYYLEAVMKRNGHPDTHAKSHLCVEGVLELNSNHEAQVERPEIVAEKNLCCWCCKSGPIGFHFRILGKSGWISGDRVPFSAEAYNMGSAGAVSLKLKFVQTTTYSTKTKSNAVTKELLSMDGPSISRGGTGLWNNACIDLPEKLPPTKLAGRSQLIGVEYSFHVVLELPRGSNLCAEIPIVIGTIPFESTVDDAVKLSF